MLSRSKAERFERFRTRKLFISPFFCEETSQEGVVRLADEQQLVALFPNNQALFPTRRRSLNHACFGQAFQLGGGVAKPAPKDLAIMLPQLRSNPAHFSRSLAHSRSHPRQLNPILPIKLHFFKNAPRLVLRILKHLCS